MLANIGTSDSGTPGAFVCPSSLLSPALSRADESFQPDVVIASPLTVNSNDYHTLTLNSSLVLTILIDICFSKHDIAPPARR
jgi:hypothetical protein